MSSGRVGHVIESSNREMRPGWMDEFAGRTLPWCLFVVRMLMVMIRRAAEPPCPPALVERERFGVWQRAERRARRELCCRSKGKGHVTLGAGARAATFLSAELSMGHLASRCSTLVPCSASLEPLADGGDGEREPASSRWCTGWPLRLRCSRPFPTRPCVTISG